MEPRPRRDPGTLEFAMSVRSLRPFALLLLATIPGFAAAAECDGGVFVATGDGDGATALDGRLLSGLGLSLVQAGIDPDIIDYDTSVEGIDPDIIDFAACLAAGSPAATIRVEGVPLAGIDPDEIDASWAAKVLSATPPAQTREHVLLARQVGVPTAALEETLGVAVLRLDALEVRTEGASSRPYTPRAVADLTLVVERIVSSNPKLEPVELWIEGETALVTGR